MAVQPQRLAASNLLDATNEIFYTSTNITTLIDDATICNTSASPVAVTIDIVDSGGAAGTVMRVISNKTLAANETYPCPELRGHYMNKGDSVQGFASIAAVATIRLSGRIVSGV
jgi:hypothetical protein